MGRAKHRAKRAQIDRCTQIAPWEDVGERKEVWKPRGRLAKARSERERQLRTSVEACVEFHAAPHRREENQVVSCSISNFWRWNHRLVMTNLETIVERHTVAITILIVGEPHDPFLQQGRMTRITLASVHMRVVTPLTSIDIAKKPFI